MSINIKDLAALVEQQNRDYFLRFQRVALCLSGGADSTALFHVFMHLTKKKYFFDLIVLHVNFGLRGSESEADEAFVRALAGRAGLAASVLNVCEPKKRGESTQVWARRVRHTWFVSYAEQGYQLVLGHNANDVAENVLLRLARGSSLENLAGMSQIDGALWRPLLGIPRPVIEDALKLSRLNWREDSSNQELHYTRNRLRQSVMPVLEALYPGAAVRMATAAQRLSLDPTNVDVAANLSSRQASRLKITAIQSFLKSARVGQSLDLGDDFKLVKAGAQDENNLIMPGPREIQHLSSLDQRQMDLILTPGVKVYLPLRTELGGLGGESGSSNDLCWGRRLSGRSTIRLPHPNDKVRIAGSNASFKFKDLMQKWKIPIRGRPSFVVVLSDESPGLKMLYKIETKSRDDYNQIGVLNG